jgi:predicted enzyme related to lactoylglutathione lyase
MAEVLSHAPGAFSWIELGTTDQNAAKEFYGNLFGWTFVDQPMGPGEVYTTFRLRGRDAGAAYTLDPRRHPGVPPHWMPYVATADADATEAPPHWLAYFAAADCDATAARAASLGAKTYVPPTDIPGTGRFAVFADPQGATFAIYRQ